MGRARGLVKFALAWLWGLVSASCGERVYVVLYTAPNCEPCEVAKRGPLVALRSAGFRVSVRDSSDPDVVVPGSVSAFPSWRVVGSRDRLVLSEWVGTPSDFVETVKAYGDLEVYREHFGLKTEYLSDRGVREVARVLRAVVSEGAPVPPAEVLPPAPVDEVK